MQAFDSDLAKLSGEGAQSELVHTPSPRRAQGLSQIPVAAEAHGLDKRDSIDVQRTCPQICDVHAVVTWDVTRSRPCVTRGHHATAGCKPGELEQLQRLHAPYACVRVCTCTASHATDVQIDDAASWALAYIGGHVQYVPHQGVTLSCRHAPPHQEYADECASFSTCMMLSLSQPAPARPAVLHQRQTHRSA